VSTLFPRETKGNLKTTTMPQNPQQSKVSETEFEKRRGISRVEVREGYAQVHVSDLSEPLTEARLAVLKAANAAGISLDFLKLTPDGMSFLVKEDEAEGIGKALASPGVSVSVERGRHVVMVHAVNMRDEEGLIASIVLQAIKSGAAVGHVSDMHDRVLMVVSKEDSSRLKKQLEGNLVGATA
jgi:aspartokinase